MAESSTITREMVEAEIATCEATELLEGAPHGSHRTPGIEKCADLARRVQKDVGPSHLEGVLGSEAVQSFFDLAFDFVHQSQAFCSLPSHMVTSQRQEGGAGKKKGYAICFLGRVGRCIVTRPLALIPAWHRSVSFGCRSVSDARHCAPHTIGKTAYRFTLSALFTASPHAMTDKIRLLVALKSVSGMQPASSSGGARA